MTKKRMFAALLTALVLTCSVFFAACGEQKAATVTLDKATVSMYEDDMPVEIAATTDAASVAYTNSDDSVLTVSTVGKIAVITPKAAGTSTVTATVAGGKTATCAVTVQPSAVPYIRLDSAAISMQVGDEDKTLTATVRNYTGEIEFTSQFPSIAELTQNGNSVNIKALTAGDGGVAAAISTITAAFTKDDVRYSTTCVLTVYKKTPTLTLDREEVTLDLDETTTLVATATDKLATAEITFSSDNPEIATVDANTGVVKAISEGTASVTASFIDGGETYSAACEVKVIISDKSRIRFPLTHMTFETGASSTLPKTVTINYMKKDGDPAISFVTGDPNIATVSAGGTDNTTATIVPVGVGQTALTVKLGDLAERSITIEVANGGLVYQLNSDETGFNIMGVKSVLAETVLYIPDYYYDAASESYLPVKGMAGGFTYNAYRNGDYVQKIAKVSIGKNIDNCGITGYDDDGQLKGDTRTGYCLGNLANNCEIDFSRNTSMTSLATHMFYKSNSTTIILPEHITAMANSVFRRCVELVNVSLGSITSIPDTTFENCTALRNIYIPKTVKSISSTAFQGVTITADIHIYYQGTQEEWKAVTGNSVLASATVHFSQSGLPQA